MSTRSPRATAKGRAMGCACEVLVVGGHDPAALAARGLQLARELEQRWSRFVPDSDISRINAAAGEPRGVPVHHSTRDLLMLAVHGWEVTEGRFDPTVHRTMEAMGYDRSHEQLASVRYDPTRRTDPGPFGPAPGCAGIEIDIERCTVRLPRGVSVDAGGIGKGLAADLVSAELRAHGAAGVMVNMGGDVRVSGESPHDDVWVVAIEDPFDTSQDLVQIRVADAGVAVSSRLTRRWVSPGGLDVHHIVDPRTGRPASDGVASSMVVAGTAWWAEVLTKAAMVEGARTGISLVERIGDGSNGLLVTDSQQVHRTGGLSAYLVQQPSAGALR